jgi:hypothetical protein
MNAPNHRPFQFTLWSLFVLTTVVAELCSIIEFTNWAVPLILIVGLAICPLGFLFWRVLGPVLSRTRSRLK